MKYISKLGAWLSVLPLLLFPMKASAQLTASQQYLTDVAGETGQSAELPELIGGVINAILSVLGIVFLVMVIYAGFLWMSDTDAKKIEKAKKMLINGVIGMVIVIAAYAISKFVMDAIVVATG
jgi:hypothetical protein